MNLPLDHQIDAAHYEEERIENQARQIEARILKAVAGLVGPSGKGLEVIDQGHAAE